MRANELTTAQTLTWRNIAIPPKSLSVLNGLTGMLVLTPGFASCRKSGG